mmetsp:Transcript_23432/g.61572  ORF Transcript_23432/g.61572 Transcript_23432/m.61572 type:complete len:300 (+) Transcript_23432:256-1155(+)
MSTTAARPLPSKISAISLAFTAAVPPDTSESGCVSSPKSAGVTVYSVTSPSRNSQTMEGPAMDSSSSTSFPCTTSARCMPSNLKTWTKRLPNCGAKTPHTIQSGLPGFVSGPSMLNTVLMPSSALIGPTCFMAGWYCRAKRKVKPDSARIRPATSGPTSKRAPSASSTSADPLDDEAARFPCLTTRAPAAATTKDAAVEMLKVFLPSPPVPTISTVGAPAGISTDKACPRIVSAIADTTSGVQRSRVSNVRKALVSTGEASPCIISCMADLALSTSNTPFSAKPLTALRTAPAITPHLP